MSRSKREWRFNLRESGDGETDCWRAHLVSGSSAGSHAGRASSVSGDAGSQLRGCVTMLSGADDGGVCSNNVSGDLRVQRALERLAVCTSSVVQARQVEEAMCPSLVARCRWRAKWATPVR
jgi:hypothetical protein